MINIELPDPNNIANVADWIELNVALGKNPISKSVISSVIQRSNGEEPSDVFISSVWDELEKRMELYGEDPPFIHDYQEVNPNIDWEKNPEYLMCLILSLFGNSYMPTLTGKLFERVSMEALRNYINGEALVFGHPSNYSVSEVCNLLNEKFKIELPPNYNDRGLDIIGWRPFNDKRGNQIVIFMQCAGGHNWTKKTGDVVLRAWCEKYITFGCPPVKGFSTVVVISKNELFEEISFETNLLLDRPRIYRNTINKVLKDITLRSEILQWCNLKVEEISN